MEINIFGRQIYVKKDIIIIAVIIAIMVLGAIGYMIKRSGGEVIVSKEDTPNEQSIQVDKANESTKAAGMGNKALDVGLAAEKLDNNEKIKVYVVGCVNKAGVVTLVKGQIIEDAIKAAGGATREADLENINLAYELNENVMLKILSKKEAQTVRQGLQSEAGNQEVKAAAKSMPGIKIVKDSGGAVASDESQPQESKSKSGKININTASESELDTLPDVGPKTAQDIIDYREKSGGFKKIEDIMNVPRIGESRFKKMKELISVE